MERHLSDLMGSTAGVHFFLKVGEIYEFIVFLLESIVASRSVNDRYNTVHIDSPPPPTMIATQPITLSLLTTAQQKSINNSKH